MSSLHRHITRPSAYTICQPVDRRAFELKIGTRLLVPSGYIFYCRYQSANHSITRLRLADTISIRISGEARSSTRNERITVGH